MTRVNEGAASAPQEPCLRQTSGPVNGSVAASLQFQIGERYNFIRPVIILNKVRRTRQRLTQRNHPCSSAWFTPNQNGDHVVYGEWERATTLGLIKRFHFRFGYHVVSYRTLK